MLNTKYIRNPELRKALEKNNRRALEGFYRDLVINLQPFSPTLHTSKRDYSRGGRVRKRQNVLGLPVGPEKPRYLRKVQALVGKAKSGWLRALRAIGGKDPQNFVTRHGEQFGSVRDLRSDTNNPRIVIANNARHILPLNRELNIVSSAIQGREAAMVKDATLKVERAKKAANV